MSLTTATRPSRHHVGIPHLPPQLQTRTRLPRRTEPAVADLTDTLEQAVVLARNRAAARGLRIHAYLFENLRVAADPKSLLSALDRMFAMASGMALWGSLVVCETEIGAGAVLVRLRFAGEGGGDSGRPAILDCELSRRWRRR